MKISHVLSPAAAMLLALSSAPALAAEETAMANQADLKWGDAPPNLPKGAKLAVLHGDPGQTGPFVVRVKMPGGYKVPPHWHSNTENLTVLSGALYLGMGEKAEPSAAHALRPGAYHYLPGKTPHFAFAKTPTVVQIHGDGPFDINYVNAADDPGKKAGQ